MSEKYIDNAQKKVVRMIETVMTFGWFFSNEKWSKVEIVRNQHCFAPHHSQSAMLQLKKLHDVAFQNSQISMNLSRSRVHENQQLLNLPKSSPNTAESQKRGTGFFGNEIQNAHTLDAMLQTSTSQIGCLEQNEEIQDRSNDDLVLSNENTQQQIAKEPQFSQLLIEQEEYKKSQQIEGNDTKGSNLPQLIVNDENSSLNKVSEIQESDNTNN